MPWKEVLDRWLDHYVGFGQYLADVGQEAFREADLCVIFHLPRPRYNWYYNINL